MSIFEGPCSDHKLAEPKNTPSGSHTTNGEGGYKKRTGGRFPEVTKDLGNRLKSPTKK